MFALDRYTRRLRRALKRRWRPNEVESFSEKLEAQQVHLRQLESLLAYQGLHARIPPRHLQIRVSGVFDPNFFDLGVGLRSGIENMLGKIGIELEDCEKILDFGCGCGRVTIPLSFKVDRSKVFGCDIDPEAIQWCSENLAGFGGFAVNPHHPPSGFADEEFDLVLGVSVFTHLPEDIQFEWLEELRRITRKQGHLVLTFHGERYYGLLSKENHEEFLDYGFSHSNLGGTTEGLPNFYLTTLHTHAYIENHWSKFFQIISIEKGAVFGQDAVLLKNP